MEVSMSEDKRPPNGQARMKEIWKSFKNTSRKKIIRPILSEAEEKKRSKRLSKIANRELEKDGTFTLPNGDEDTILLIKFDGILVLEKYGDYDLLVP